MSKTWKLPWRVKKEPRGVDLWMKVRDYRKERDAWPIKMDKSMTVKLNKAIVMDEGRINGPTVKFLPGFGKIILVADEGHIHGRTGKL